MTDLEGTYDACIVGVSIAGLAAAIELVTRGLTVGICECAYDSVTLRGALLIEATPLNSASINGAMFEKLAFERLGGNAARLSPAAESALTVDGGIQVLSEGVSIARSPSLLFTPNGKEPGPQPYAHRFLGLGVSYDAWSDGPFSAGQSVAVVGCGSRAATEALIVAKWAASVSLSCSQPRLHTNRGLEAMLLAASNVHIRTACEVRGIDERAGKVAAVQLLEAEKEWNLPVKWIYFANDPVVDWSLFRDSQLIPRAVAAGLAAGAAYDDSMALYESGKQAAVEVLRRQ